MKTKKTKAPSIRILGIMTGTSCDGLDAACLEINFSGWKQLWTASAPYPKELRKAVLSCQTPDTEYPIKRWLEIHRDLGIWYGNAIDKIIRSKSPRPDLIANHGQTVAHFPEKNCKGTTLQLGEATRISNTTQLSVVTDFRSGDLAAGGQGAPLVPLFHRMIAEKLKRNPAGIAIHNLGGISNLTYLGPRNLILAFDTGPGNIWIDAAASEATQGRKRVDWGGQMAADGTPDYETVLEILKHPYFSLPPPKSTGRDDFPIDYFFSRAQVTQKALVATATEITAESIAQAYEKWILQRKLPLREIFFCGGGAKNLTLLRRIQDLLPQVRIQDLNNHGFDSQFIEAQAFAVFGFLALFGQPLGGKWTGATSFGPPAHIVPGKNWPQVLRKTNAILEYLQS